MEKLICSQNFIDPLYFNNFFINDNGNIVLGSRDTKVEFDRMLETSFTISPKTRLEYYDRSGTEMVRILFGNRVYEDVLPALFIRSYLGYNFNRISDYEGITGLKTLFVDNVGLQKPYQFRKRKLSTKQEQRFYDLWVSVINEPNTIQILHGKYFNKWCKFQTTDKAFKDKFLYMYRAAIKRLQVARAGICSEVLVAFSGHFYFIDFFIPSLNLGVEIDGYHHYQLDKAVDDYIRTSEILEKRTSMEIIRFPNKNIEQMTIGDVRSLVELCYDRCGFQAVSSIARLRDIKTLNLKRIAKSILNGQSAAKFPDLHTQYISKKV